jgi:hypothetical protein
MCTRLQRRTGLLIGTECSVRMQRSSEIDIADTRSVERRRASWEARRQRAERSGRCRGGGGEGTERAATSRTLPIPCRFLAGFGLNSPEPVLSLLCTATPGARPFQQQHAVRLFSLPNCAAAFYTTRAATPRCATGCTDSVAQSAAAWHASLLRAVRRCDVLRRVGDFCGLVHAATCWNALRRNMLRCAATQRAAHSRSGTAVAAPSCCR